MNLIIFIAYLISSVMVVSGAWVPSILAIKIYLVVTTLAALISVCVDKD